MRLISLKVREKSKRYRNSVVMTFPGPFINRKTYAPLFAMASDTPLGTCLTGDNWLLWHTRLRSTSVFVPCYPVFVCYKKCPS